MSDILNGVTTYTDVDGKKAKIPSGFTVSTTSGETKVSDGLVVTATDGSEFVWVPVSNPVLDVQGKSDAEINIALQEEVTAGRYPMAIKVNNTDYKGVLYIFGGTTSVTITAATYSTTGTGWREPDILTYAGIDDTASNYSNAGITGITNSTEFKAQLQNEYNQMMASIIRKGGFYIGRYETSLNGGNTQSKVNVTPMVNNAANLTWYGMYQKQKLYVTNNSLTGMTSAMIWGSQWDQVMIWMREVQNPNASNNPYVLYSTGMGWYSDNSGGSRKNTGTLPAAKVKNIYDMAGNAMEFTMRANSNSYRIAMGGSYDYDVSVRFPYGGSPTFTYPFANDGSRLVLY